jgi:hypothetical protein
MLDDPKQLPTAPLHLVFQLLFMTSFPVLPALVIGLVVWAGFKWRRILSAPQYSVRICIFRLGLGALWILALHDPGRVWDWFLD